VPERRAHPRVKGPFEGFWDGAGTQAGRIVDLSVSGCFIQSVTLPKAGQIVTVSIAISGGQINLPAEVLYAESNKGFAVRFVDTPVEVANVLRKEIANKMTR
jgi:PilZ domain